MNVSAYVKMQGFIFSVTSICQRIRPNRFLQIVHYFKYLNFRKEIFVQNSQMKIEFALTK